MKRRRIERHVLAREDTRAAVDHYLLEAGDDIAMAFIDAIDAALRDIAEIPMAGSSRLGQEVDLPTLRSWRLKRFPYLVFYMDRGDDVLVWRVLHAQRDLPSTLADLDPRP